MTTPNTQAGKLLELAEEARRVARSLTKGQWGFLLMPFMTGYGHTGWFHDSDDQLARAIYRKGLATRQKARVGTSVAIPTPLGLAVRALAQEHQS